MSLKGGFLKEPCFPAFKGRYFVIEDETISLLPD
jgi:hypothetical protein